MGSTLQRQQQVRRLLLSYFDECDRLGKTPVLIEPVAWLKEQMEIAPAEADVILASLSKNTGLGYIRGCGQKQCTCDKAAARRQENLSSQAIRAAYNEQSGDTNYDEQVVVEPEMPPTYEELAALVETLRAKNAQLAEEKETANRQIRYAEGALERHATAIRKKTEELQTTQAKLAEARTAKRELRAQLEAEIARLNRELEELKAKQNSGAPATIRLPGSLLKRVQEVLSDT